MGKVFIMDHPLIQHKIGIIRNIETGTKQFRELISEIATLECFEATRDLELEDYPRHGLRYGNTSSGGKNRSHRSLS